MVCSNINSALGVAPSALGIVIDGLLHVEQYGLALPSRLGLLHRIAKIALPLALLVGQLNGYAGDTT